MIRLRSAKARLVDTANLTVTAVLVIAVTLALRTVGYRRLQTWLPRSGTEPPGAWRMRRLSRQMERVARWMPGSTCLPQAVAGYVLLAARGFECRIRIGVAGDAATGFRAHATLLSGSHVLIGGGGDWDRFVSLTDLRPGR